MSVDWANRQRHTNQLVRKLAKYLFCKDKVLPNQLHGLSKLSWITNSHEGENAGYLFSTKIPALENIFDRSYKSCSLKKVSEDIASILNDNSIVEMVQKHTGFTNFYKPYRNSSLEWLKDNFDALLPLYKAAYSANSSKDRMKLVEAISKTPGIPKANHPEQRMKPEYLLTPTFFMLDQEVKFPIINGNKEVKKLLKALDVHDSDLVTQYSAMVKLYGVGGIDDAADLDQVGGDLAGFIDTPERSANKKILKIKNTKNKDKLPLKDEADVEVIRKSGTIIQRRIHNQITNKLRACLSGFTLLEGCDNSCMFDVIIKNYDNENDLIVEVKSSLERPNIRMAIGQLFDYQYNLKGDKELHLVILLPEEPDIKCAGFLKWMGIGLMWFDDDQLCTSTEWLEQLATVS